MVSTLKGENFLPEEQILSFKSGSFLRTSREAKEKENSTASSESISTDRNSVY